MMKLLTIFILLLPLTNATWAEGNCPAGFYPNAGGCAPIPGGPATNNQDLIEKMKRDGVPHPGRKVYRMIDSFIAAAWHPHANETWIVHRNTTSIKDAEARVLSACNKAMGGNCSIAASGKNVSIVVLYKDKVLTDITLDESYTNALRKAKERNNCSNEEWNTKCKPRTFSTQKVIDPKEYDFEGDTTESVFPTGEINRR